MNIEEEIERSERYIASNKRLLASMEQAKDNYMKEFNRKQFTLLEEIRTEEESLKRKKAKWLV